MMYRSSPSLSTDLMISPVSGMKEEPVLLPSGHVDWLVMIRFGTPAAVSFRWNPSMSSVGSRNTMATEPSRLRVTALAGVVPPVTVSGTTIAAAVAATAITMTYGVRRRRLVMSTVVLWVCGDSVIRLSVAAARGPSAASSYAVPGTGLADRKSSDAFFIDGFTG